MILTIFIGLKDYKDYKVGEVREAKEEMLLKEKGRCPRCGLGIEE